LGGRYLGPRGASGWLRLVAENNGKTKVSVSLYEKGQNPPKPVTENNVKTNVLEGGAPKQWKYKGLGVRYLAPRGGSGWLRLVAENNGKTKVSGGWLSEPPPETRKPFKNQSLLAVAQFSHPLLQS
jgi:hypothetical protein